MNYSVSSRFPQGSILDPAMFNGSVHDVAINIKLIRLEISIQIGRMDNNQDTSMIQCFLDYLVMCTHSI